MKRKDLKRAVRFLLVGCVFTISCLSIPATAKAVVKLKMQTIIGPSLYTYKFLEQEFAKAVKDRTNGDVEIKTYPVGALAKPLEQFDALKRGSIDMSFSMGLYNAQKVPIGLIEAGLPFSFDTSEQFYNYLNSWREGEVYDIINSAYNQHNIVYLGSWAGGSAGIMTNFPVTSLKDLKGKKIRTLGLWAFLAKNVGAAPVTLPISEQYIALNRKTIDGTIFPYLGLETAKLREVVSHIIYPPIMTNMIASFYANKKSFDKLSVKNQRIIKQAVVEFSKPFTDGFMIVQTKAIEEARARGIKLVQFDPADVKDLKAKGRSLWPAAAKKSEEAKEALKLLEGYLEEKGLK